MKNNLLICLLLSVLSGCATTNAHFTNHISSPTQQDEEYLSNNFVLVEKDGEVVMNRHFFVYIPLSGYYQFNDETAVEKILRKYDGDLVTNLTIEKKLLFLLYYNRYYVVAKGDVWRRKRAL